MLKKVSQILCFILMGLTIIEYSLLVRFTEPYDRISSQILTLTVITSSCWAVFCIVVVLINGVNVNPLHAVINTVRILFTKGYFIAISLLLFLTTTIILTHFLFNYRQVELTCSEPVTVYESRAHENHRNIELGILDENTTALFRLRCGTTYLYCVSRTGEVSATEAFEVCPFWKDQQKITIKTLPRYDQL